MTDSNKPTITSMKTDNTERLNVFLKNKTTWK